MEESARAVVPAGAAKERDSAAVERASRYGEAVVASPEWAARSADGAAGVRRNSSSIAGAAGPEGVRSAVGGKHGLNLAAAAGLGCEMWGTRGLFVPD